MWQERCLMRADAMVLSRMAEHLLRLAEVAPNAGEALAEIVAQARILPEGQAASGHVALYDKVTYDNLVTGARQSVTLVAPDEAEPRAGRISCVSPVALAVLGVAVGSEVTVQLPDGREWTIAIVAAEPSAVPA